MFYWTLLPRGTSEHFKFSESKGEFLAHLQLFTPKPAMSPQFFLMVNGVFHLVCAMNKRAILCLRPRPFSISSHSQYSPYCPSCIYLLLPTFIVTTLVYFKHLSFILRIAKIATPASPSNPFSTLRQNANLVTSL